jgi:hypothetical protein
MDDYDGDDIHSEIVEDDVLEDDVSADDDDSSCKSSDDDGADDKQDELDDEVKPSHVSRRKPIITKINEQTPFEKIAIISFRISQLSTYIRGMDTIEQMTYLPKHDLDVLIASIKPSAPPYLLMKQIATREYTSGLLSSHMGVTRL